MLKLKIEKKEPVELHNIPDGSLFKCENCYFIKIGSCYVQRGFADCLKLSGCFSLVGLHPKTDVYVADGELTIMEVNQ